MRLRVGLLCVLGVLVGCASRSTQVTELEDALHSAKQELHQARLREERTRRDLTAHLRRLEDQLGALQRDPNQPRVWSGGLASGQSLAIPSGRHPNDAWPPLVGTPSPALPDPQGVQGGCVPTGDARAHLRAALARLQHTPNPAGGKLTPSQARAVQALSRAPRALDTTNPWLQEGEFEREADR